MGRVLYWYAYRLVPNKEICTHRLHAQAAKTVIIYLIWVTGIKRHTAKRKRESPCKRRNWHVEGTKLCEGSSFVHKTISAGLGSNRIYLSLKLKQKQNLPKCIQMLLLNRWEKWPGKYHSKQIPWLPAFCSANPCAIHSCLFTDWLREDPAIPLSLLFIRDYPSSSAALPGWWSLEAVGGGGLQDV